jgi:hypothetical protein
MINKFKLGDVVIKTEELLQKLRDLNDREVTNHQMTVEVIYPSETSNEEECVTCVWFEKNIDGTSVELKRESFKVKYLINVITND